MKTSTKLINLLCGKDSVFIQTHDFPDPDAIAAAFGLQYFLKQKGIKSNIIYDGELQTNPVKSMIKDLGISLKNIGEVAIGSEDKIIIVDGCPGNENINIQPGNVVAVIDHHQVEKPGNCLFVDIRKDYGSCSTIVAEYMQEQNIQLTSSVATALAIGIHVDTSSFRRRTNLNDLEAFKFLFHATDQNLLGLILRNNLFEKELIVYEKAIEGVSIDSKFAFYYFPDNCSQNLLGIIADFFLAIDEVEFVALCGKSDDKIIFSTRSENLKWKTSPIIKAVLKDLGAGGGHDDMAGGVIKDISLFKEEQIYQRFRKQLGL